MNNAWIEQEYALESFPSKFRELIERLNQENLNSNWKGVQGGKSEFREFSVRKCNRQLQSSGSVSCSSRSPGNS
jgi:hypothetical protein